MAWGTAPLFRLLDEPYYRGFTTQAPPDDWQWREGKPTPLSSPLIPHHIHPTVQGRLYGQPIIEPRYSISHQGVPLRNSITSPFRYTSFTPLNRPSFITDHHVIGLRAQVESLWAPRFAAHCHLDVTGELIISPLYRVHHRLAAQAYTIGYNAFGDPTNHRIYSFGMGGILTGGHEHVWGAGALPAGSSQWSCRLILEDPHGGAIGPDQGNYEILDVSWSYTLTKWFRRVYSQDSLRHYTHDLDAYTKWFQQPIPTTFGFDEVMGYCMDAGALWLHPGNTHLINGEIVIPHWHEQKTFGWTACTIPDRENILRPWFSCGRTHVPTSGPRGLREVLGHPWYDARETSYYIDRAVEYWKESTVVTGQGTEFQTEVIRGDAGNDPPPGGPDAYPGDRWVTNVIGTRVVPTFYVKVMDLNENVRTHVVTDCEFPNSDL